MGEGALEWHEIPKSVLCDCVVGGGFPFKIISV